MRPILRLPSAQLARPSGCFNRSQWRTIERQWQRHLSLRLRRPTPPPATASSTLRRHASSAAAAPSNRLRNFVYGSGLVLFFAFGYLYITDTRASIHHWLVVPSLRFLHSDPEEAHHAGIRYIQGLYNFNLHPRERSKADQALGDLTVEVFGHMLDNPVGTSAGIDKNAQIPSPLFALGPSIVEVGGATPHPQDGEAGVPPGSLSQGRLLAVNIGKNKATPDSDIHAIARDYVYCVDHLAKYADILVVNVSSPNTPGLRDLQATGPLTTILSAVVDAAKSCDRATKPAVMVKVSPDEDTDRQIEGICSAVWASGVDGVIVGNTTKKRPDPVPHGYALPAKDEKVLTEMGGYSGPQLFSRTLNLVKKYRQLLDLDPPDDVQKDSPSPKQPALTLPATGPTTPSHAADESTQRDAQRLKPLTEEANEASEQSLLKAPERHADSVPPSPVPSTPSPFSSNEPKVIFATGGITNGEQCLQILNAGASVCQVYTAMMYGGVGTITRMKSEMRDEIQKGKGRSS